MGGAALNEKKQKDKKNKTAFNQQMTQLTARRRPKNERELSKVIRLGVLVS